MELVCVVADFLLNVYDFEGYCFLHDESKALRLTCKFFYDTLQPRISPLQQMVTKFGLCQSVADMSCPKGRDSMDPFDRPLYNCAPFLHVRDWYESASKRCICQISRWREDDTANNGFCKYFWRADDSMAIFPKGEILSMKLKCQDLLEQIARSVQEGSSLLATTGFPTLDKFFRFQECMRRWGFVSDKMRVCARRQVFHSNNVVIYWQKNVEESSTDIQSLRLT